MEAFLEFLQGDIQELFLGIHLGAFLEFLLGTLQMPILEILRTFFMEILQVVLLGSPLTFLLGNRPEISSVNSPKFASRNTARVLSF